MRHQIRTAVVAGTSALLLTVGAGTASAQGSLQFALPFPIDIPGLASLAGGDEAEAPAAGQQAQPAVAMPPEMAQAAFDGRIVAGVNEARTAVGAERLVTDPELSDRAGARAMQLAAGDAVTGDLTVPPEASEFDRTVLEQPADASPQSVLAQILGDTGMRERMLDGEFTKVGVGTATADNGRIHAVLDFE